MNRHVRAVALWMCCIAGDALACRQPSPSGPPSHTEVARSAAPQQPLQPPQAAAEPAVLSAVTLPDLAALPLPVQRQLQAEFDRLSAGVNGGATSASDRANAYGRFGHVMAAAGFFDRATLAYRHAASFDGSDARWPYHAGHALLRSGDRAGAIQAFERALAMRPRDVPTLVWLGDTYLDEDRPEDAKAAYARALQVDDGSAAALFGAGRAALATQSYAEAVQFLERALQIAPSATAVEYPLAMAHRALGHADVAAEHLARRGTVTPPLPDPLIDAAAVTLDSATSYESRGMDALRRQDWSGAVATLREGLRANPDDVSLRYWLGNALYVSGDQAGAEREFRSVIARQPAYARAHFSLGALLAARGQQTAARDAYAEAVRQAPTMPDAHLRLAATLRTLNRTRDAMPHYAEAVRLDPSKLEGWVGGLEALLQLQDREAARAWYARAQLVHPGSKDLATLAARLP